MTEFNTTLEQAKKLVSKGRMSRRDFVQLAVASGVTAVAADKLFVTAARAEPKKGGTFKIGIGHGATTDSMDPGPLSRPVHRNGACGERSPTA